MNWLSSPWVMIAGLLLTFAILFDLSRRTGSTRRMPGFPTVPEEVRNTLAGIDGPAYRDPRGRFSVARPPGWQMAERPDAGLYDVRFVSPNRASLAVMATPVAYDDLPSLYKEVKQREAAYQMHVEVGTVKVAGHDAIKRVVPLAQIETRAYDFVAGHTAYHILCQVPADFTSQYDYVFSQLLAGFQPLTPTAATRAAGQKE